MRAWKYVSVSVGQKFRAAGHSVGSVSKGSFPDCLAAFAAPADLLGLPTAPGRACTSRSAIVVRGLLQVLTLGVSSVHAEPPSVADLQTETTIRVPAADTPKQGPVLQRPSQKRHEAGKQYQALSFPLALATFRSRMSGPTPPEQPDIERSDAMRRRLPRPISGRTGGNATRLATVPKWTV